MGTGETIIKLFFNDNYQTLLGISTDYSSRYQYNLMQPDEIVSELYLYTLGKPSREDKLASLIQMSAATINYMFNSKAYYYITHIIYRLTSGKRTFENNCNINKLEIDYYPTIFNVTDDPHEIKETDYYGVEDIIELAKELSVGDDWYKYKIWHDYYVARFSYKELSVKYQLSISPIFSMVQDFNEKIRNHVNLAVQNQSS